MTPAERVRSAFDHREPDRVPVYEQSVCCERECPGRSPTLAAWVRSLLVAPISAFGSVSEACKPGGGFIFGSSNSIHAGIPTESFLSMQEAAREFGKYVT